VDPATITAIVNCHMHWDHAGGNYELPGIPIYVQAAELEAARQPDFTLPEYTFDFPGARLRTIVGEHELLPGIRIVPTPGHTPGHQSLILDTDDGKVMLAGQASDTASAFSAQALAVSTGTGTFPDWMTNLRAWNVRRVLFAHDLLVWEPESNDSGRAVVG
jgi:N-acyl homoserine lactone hydrolase